MKFRPVAIALALILPVALAACDSSSSGSCSSAADVNPTGAALTDDIQKAESAGKIDRAKAADAMTRMLGAESKYASNRDYRVFCNEIAKIRRDSGL